MKALTRLLIGILVLLASSALSETNTNSSPCSNSWTVTLELRSERSEKSRKFWERLSYNLEEIGTIKFTDEFGFPSRLGRLQELRDERYAFIETINHDGRGVFLRTGRDSLRETVVAFLPLDEWENGGDGAWTATREFLVGFIGRTKEENIEVVSQTYSTVDKSWWDEARADGMFEYGIRPIRTTPYVYLTSNLWKQGNDGPLLQTLIRYKYQFPSVGRVEMEVLLHVTHSYRIVGGASFDPVHLGASGDQAVQVSIRLERVFGKKLDAFSIGSDGGGVNIGFGRSF